MADTTISGTSNPYGIQHYVPESNDKNTMTITDYFKLLSAQLQNQDMSNPMDNSEMMAQLTQMAMVQSMTAMTNAVQTSSAISTSVYAASLVDKKITVADTKENSMGLPEAVGVIYGVVKAVNLTGGNPTVILDDGKEYPLSYVLGMGEIKDPYNKDEGKDDGSTEGGSGGDGSTEEKVPQNVFTDQSRRI